MFAFTRRKREDAALAVSDTPQANSSAFDLRGRGRVRIRLGSLLIRVVPSRKIYKVCARVRDVKER